MQRNKSAMFLAYYAPLHDVLGGRFIRWGLGSDRLGGQFPPDFRFVVDAVCGKIAAHRMRRELARGPNILDLLKIYKMLCRLVERPYSPKLDLVLGPKGNSDISTFKLAAHTRVELYTVWRFNSTPD